MTRDLLCKTLAKCKHCGSSTVLHRELNILKDGELSTLNILIFVYKQHSNLHPCVFNQFYKLNNSEVIKIGLEKTV